MRGRLIVVEGTDCSGKETQTNLLKEKLEKDGISVKKYSFPMYDTPTGKIVGGPYLGKSYICDGWFPEGASHVDYKVASLLFAADRLYNIDIINKDLDEGYDVILDRYIYSNMAHQGGKITDIDSRYKVYNFIDSLEFKLLGLPEADVKIFLHMPTEYAAILKKGREEKPDQHEADEAYLKQAENAYIEIAERYNFKTVECVTDNKIRTIDNINDEVYSLVKKNNTKRLK
jgi:dTMP kinase